MPAAIPIILVAAVEGGLFAGGLISGLAALGTIFVTAALTGLQMLMAPSSSGGGPGATGGGGFPATDPGAKYTDKNAAQPRTVVYGSTRIAGTIVYQAVSNGNSLLSLVVALADHECESIDEVWFGDVKAWTAAGGNVTSYTDAQGNAQTSGYSGNFNLYPHLGGDGQVADSNLIANVGAAWSPAYKLSGVTYLYISMSWNRSVFAGFSPDQIWAVVKGKKVFDPRSSTTAWSQNPALCVADYLADAKHGLGETYGTSIDNTVLAAAASVCDATVASPGNTATAPGFTEPRFTLNGAFTLDQKPMDVLAGMLGAMVGTLVWTGGVWKVRAAAWQTPTLSFDEDDLRAPFTVQNLLGRSATYNSENGTYTNTLKNYQPDSFPVVSPASFVAADGGIATYKPITLPFTTSPTMAQRIAIIDLRRMRQTLSMTYPCKLSGWRAAVGDVVQISNDRLGWSNKTFEVVGTTMQFDSAQVAGATKTLLIGVDLALRESDSSVYEDTVSGGFDVAPLPPTNLPDPFNVGPPFHLRASESLYNTNTAAGVRAKWTLVWDASNDAFVTSGGAYRPQYRLQGASAWLSLADTTDLTVDVLDIAPGTYEARVYSVNYRGMVSQTAAVLPPTPVAGLSAPPAAPTGLTVNAVGGLAVARWDQTPDLDVLQGGSIVFRFSSATSGATWDAAISIADPQPGNLTVAVLPLKSGTYLAKFLDSSGNYSGVASFVQNQTSLLSFTTLASATENPTFGGTKTNTVVASSLLELDSAGSFDAVASVDALASWDFAGGVDPSGSYAFTSAMDLGSVKQCRVTSAITSQVVNVFDDFDSRATDSDTWASWDGPVTGEEADAVLMVRTTQTDPAGSPVWTDWQRLDSAEFNVRGLQFRLDLESTDSSFNIQISQLSVVAEHT